MQKTKNLSKWLCTITLLVLLSTTHAQCLPDFSNWDNVTRITYEGNWLLNESGLGFGTNPPPNRSVLSSTTNNDGFGLDDYDSDNNFTTVPIALENSPVIRVGKKFNQTGQGELSPIRRANVATFTFNPTAENCKIRVHYIGVLQELSIDPFYYSGGSAGNTSGALQRFRRIINAPVPTTAARNAASFGLFCRYEYGSNAKNLNNLLQSGGTLSRVGRTEFGLSIPNPLITAFTLPAQNTDYGLNDMFSFSKAGTNLRTLPNTGTLNKKMDNWDSYVMDFSEFIGGTVTITLFGSTSNYIGETQNHSYCYYQFECLNETATPLPTSTLLDIPDLDFGGCLPALPTNIDINITDTVPTIVGSSLYTSTVQQINNGNIHRWLHLPDINARRYHNHFATLRIQFLNNSNDWVNFTGFSDLGTIDSATNSPDIRISSLPGTPTSTDVNGMRTYSFRVLYSVRTNTSSPTTAASAPVQEDTFNIIVGLASEEELEGGLTCNTPSTGNLEATINGVTATESHTTICRVAGVTLPTINFTLGASPCTTDLTYIWQKRTSITWSDITNQTNANFNSAQSQVSTTACFTQFRRVTIFTVIVCGEIRLIRIPSEEIFTVYNSGFLQASGTSSVSVLDNDTSVSNEFSNISLNLSNNVLVCYGNTVTINANLTLGGSCNLPDAPNADVSVNFLVNGFPALEIPLLTSITGNNSINENFSFSFNAVNNPALGINVFGSSGAVSVPVRVVISVNRGGCTSTKTLNLLTLQLFPRAIGGEIFLNPSCPGEVNNNSEVFTMTYAAEPGLGYVWEYCSDYTDIGGVLTCNDTWQPVPNQFQLNMPLAALTANNISQPIIVRRVAQSGNNCGGAQFSNSVEIDLEQETPIFNLPVLFCEGNITTTRPQATPTVSGTWHLMTAVGSGNTFATNPTTQLPDDLTAGDYAYIFIPDTANSSCYAPLVWNFEVIAPNPGTLSSETTIAINTSTQITATVANGTWTSSNPAIATVDNNGLVTAVSNGTVTITYAVAGDCPSEVSIVITVVNCLETTTWNGTTWSNGTPNTPAFLNTAIVFNASFSTTEDLYACSVTVNNNAEVIVEHIGNEETNTGHTLTVKHEVTVTNGASLEFDDDTSLVQIEDDANFGNIIYKRITPKIQRLDYVYWSSPVAGQNLFALSNITPANRFYFWNPAGNTWGNALPSTTVMETGKGYIIRGPESGFSSLNEFTGIFNGVPNNGTITTPVLNSTSKANLIGNPYPSALDIDCFLADPDNAHLEGFVRLWSHNIPIDFSGNTPGTQAFNYNINSYVTYNRLGGVGSGITAIDMAIEQGGGTRFVFSTDRPRGKVAAGQSFFVNTTSTGVATFKNNMRAGSQNQENSQFYRNANIPAGESSPCVSEDRHRLWLQIRNTTTVNGNPEQFKQTLVGYADNATTSTSLDRDYDSGLLNTSHPTTVNIYSLNPANDPLMIQGRALAAPFDTSDIIPLGFSCKYLGSSGSNSIQIAPSEFDGLFETTDFWLRENIGGGNFAYHDIRTTPFEFTITADVVDDTNRFAVVFSNPLPRQAQPKKDTFKVIASPNTFEKSITFEVVSDHNSNITIQIYDLLGKLVEEGEYSFKNFTEQQFGTKLSTGMYQAVITQGSQKSVQKIIKK